MRPLMEAGKIYVAQPPLYQVKKGKHIEYVLDDPQLNAKLAELGLKDTALLVREEGKPERVIDTAGLKRLTAEIDTLETQTRILARRGVALKDLLDNHRHSEHGLPKMLVYIHRPDAIEAEHHYLYTEQDLDDLREREAAEHGEVEVLEGRHILLANAENGRNGKGKGNGNGDPDMPDHRIVRYPLAECRLLDETIAHIESFDLPIDDLFLVREELVTGELPPAKYVLREADGTLKELDNLAQVAPGVRDVGREGLAIKRFKGLGEMNADELWDTTMNAQARTLLRVVISEDPDNLEQADIDAREADRIFRLLMGENVEQRRRFIEDNAANVKNLDV
jgi:DNA gyrase subunit B